ncbi:hypothetical protein [Saccharospirillum salsuginis]|uniref:Uncharacterized protein n=1 Tax=Saccharospirillum salsuginis TaxID=418750 RepID=A0A918K662_9GAMM|nr:hypothetical protein [Saccharospirillum salsuginis]GGX51442.1 hypothetical protein GCM10007392_18410 [Saccharospirillum salsuginis]
MFALIISILAIILAVALAGVSVYYGGDAFSNGSEEASAATLTNQGSQIEAAMTLYRAENGEAATTANAATLAGVTDTNSNSQTWDEVLVAENYLKQVPVSEFDTFVEESGYVISENVGAAVCDAFEKTVSVATAADLAAAVGNAEGISGCIDSTDAAGYEGKVFYYAL